MIQKEIDMRKHTQKWILKKDKFASIVNNYHNSEYTDENLIKNDCKDCENDESS